MNDPLEGINPPESNGMAIAALVIGIGSMVLAIIPIIGFLSWILSPLAIILGAIALRKTVSRGAAIGGIVTGVIGVLICIAWVAFVGAAINAMPPGAMEDIQQQVEQAAQEANQPDGVNQADGAGAASGDYQASGASQSSGDYQAGPVNNAASGVVGESAGAGVGAGTGAGTSGGK